MGSVWDEEVYTGLQKELLDSVTYKNAGEYVFLPKSRILVRKPEEEFKPEGYPCVSMYVTGKDFNAQRHTTHPIVESIDKRKATAVMRESPVTYDLSMQIDFWAKSQSHIDCMTSSWLEEHFRQFNLPVKDSDDVERTINCLRAKQSVVKSDLLSGGERLYHSIISYTMWVDLQPKKRYNASVVTKVVIDVEQK